MTVTYRCEEIIKGAFLWEVMIQDHSVHSAPKERYFGRQDQLP